MVSEQISPGFAYLKYHLFLIATTLTVVSAAILKQSKVYNLDFSSPRCVDMKKMPTDFMTFQFKSSPQTFVPVVVGREYNILSSDNGRTWRSSHEGGNFSSIIHHFPSRPLRGAGVTIIGSFNASLNSTTSITTKGGRAVSLIRNFSSHSPLPWKIDVSKRKGAQTFGGMPPVKTFGLGGSSSVVMPDGSLRLTAVVKRSDQLPATSSGIQKDTHNLPPGCIETKYCPLSSCCAAHCRIGPGNRSSVFLFASSNNGISWDYLSTIADSESIPSTISREGPNENDLLLIQSPGTLNAPLLLAVIRFDGGDGCDGHNVNETFKYAPYHISRSFDEGKTWSSPVPIPAGCARPRLLQMGDILLLSGGRYRFANTSDVILWSTHISDIATLPPHQWTWQEYSLSYHHNLGVERTSTNNIPTFNARVNKSRSPWIYPRETNAYTSLAPLNDSSFLVFYDMQIPKHTDAGVDAEHARSFAMEVTIK